MVVAAAAPLVPPNELVANAGAWFATSHVAKSSFAKVGSNVRRFGDDTDGAILVVVVWLAVWVMVGAAGGGLKLAHGSSSFPTPSGVFFSTGDVPVILP